MTAELRPFPNTANDPHYQTLPHNDEAEQALVGAMLVNNEVANRVSVFLRPEHFFQPVHGRIYEMVVSFVERGQMATPVTLKAYFDDDEALADIGGSQYLSRLAGSAVSIINAEDYGRVVHDLYLRRELINLGEDVARAAFDFRSDTPITEQIEEAERALFHLSERGAIEARVIPFREALDAALAFAEAAKERGGAGGVPTGLRALDEIIGGLVPGGLYVLAGRPSMGKTALATTIAVSAARSGCHVAFFSLEMEARDLAARVLAASANVAVDKFLRGVYDDYDSRSIVGAKAALSDLGVLIDDSAAITIQAIRGRARRLKRRDQLDLIVVDYLQLISAADRRPESRVQEIADMTRALKQLAKEMGVPVLVLSQLSRAVEQRDNKRPQLSDLRDSGAIEQDADVVMFIYREAYYLARNEPSDPGKYDGWLARCAAARNRADVIVAKQRMGREGVARLRFDATRTNFADPDDGFDEAPRQTAGPDDEGDWL